MKLWTLFFEFIKIGSLAFGGGYTILAIVEKSLVKRQKWITEQELIDYIAMSQSLPGIIAINFSAFVGYKRAGFLGAWCAVLGVITAPILAVLVLAHFIEQITHYPLFISVLYGIKIAVCGLIFSMALTLCKNALKGYVSLLIFTATLVSYMYFGLSPVWPIIGAGIVGYLFYKKTGKVFNA